MISPNVTTLGVCIFFNLSRGPTPATCAFAASSAARLWPPQSCTSRCGYVGNNSARVVRDDVELLRRDRLRVNERRADADRDGAGAEPFARVIDRHTAGWHQL